MNTNLCLEILRLANQDHWEKTPNGERYAPSGVLVGGGRQRHFDGTIFKLRNMPKNAATPPVGCTLF